MRTNHREELEAELQEWIEHTTLPLAPTRMELSTFYDLLDHESWRVTLTLPEPEGMTWPTLESFQTRRAVARKLDQIAASHDAELQGSTLVNLTVDAVSAADVAEDDDPSEETHDSPLDFWLDDLDSRMRA
jgi:hypothetical protein